MENRHRHIARILIALFAIFYCGNIAFVHAHFDETNERWEMHCHPYLPGTDHSHTHQNLASIAQAQAALTVIDCPGLTLIPEPIESTEVITAEFAVPPAFSFSTPTAGRGPPAAC